MLQISVRNKNYRPKLQKKKTKEIRQFLSPKNATRTYVAKKRGRII